MRKENTFNQGLDENLICRSLEFFASQKIGMTLLFVVGCSACTMCADTGLWGVGIYSDKL